MISPSMTGQVRTGPWLFYCVHGRRGSENGDYAGGVTPVDACKRLPSGHPRPSRQRSRTISPELSGPRDFDI
jgi:hypothetical protein